MKQCKNCGWVNRDSDIVCSSCNTELHENHLYVCNGCGKIFDGNANFCSKCGLKRGEVPKNVTDTTFKSKVDELIKVLNIDKTKVVLKNGAETVVETAAIGVEKAKEVMTEENKEKVINVARQTVGKVQEFGNEAVEKIQKVVESSSKENVDAALAPDETVQGKKVIKSSSVVKNNVPSINSEEIIDVEVKKEESNIGKREFFSWIVAFFVALTLGFFLTFVDPTKFKLYDPTEMLNRLTYSKVMEGKEICTVTSNNAALIDSPDTFNSNVIMNLAYGTKLEFISNVPSNEREATKAVTSTSVTWFELFRKKLKIPQGLPVTIIGKSGDYIIGTFNYQGKTYQRNFHDYQLRIPYVGNYRKVMVNNQIGYVRASQTTNPAFM